MRVVVFVLAAYISIAPAVAAWNFVIQAGVATVGTMAKSAGKYIKIPNKKELLLQGGGGAALAYCANNKKCRDAVGDGIDELLDMMTDSDDNGSSCFYIQTSRKKIFGTTFENTCHKVNEYHKNELGHSKATFRSDDTRCVVNNKINTPFVYRVEHCRDTDKEDKQQELTKKIINNIDDREINYIINNYGDEIDIDKYCASNACDEMSKDFGKEVENNQNKYDIDKINKANCIVEQGKIVSCDNAKIDIDKEETNHEKENDSNDKKTDKEDDEYITCDYSGFYKKVCNFINWYESDEYKKTDTKIDIQDDTPTPTNTNINFNGSCPAPYVYHVNIRFGSLGSINEEIMLLDTIKLCNFLDDWVQPIMMFLGPLHAIYIIGRHDE